MADANLEDFYARVDRIHKIGRHGTAVATTGFFRTARTTGSAGRGAARVRRQRMPIFRPLAIVLLVFVGLKGVIHAQVGAATYQKRIDALESGTAPERLSAYVLKADGMTIFLSNQIRQMFPRF